MIYLKLQPHQQSIVAICKNLKLTLQYYHPFRILERVGPVTYRLELPEGSQIHSVFHVSLLKWEIQDPLQASSIVPLTREEGQLVAQPVRILDRKRVHKMNKAATQVLVKWRNLREEKATWEDYGTLKGQLPHFDPWAQESFGVGGM